MPNKRRGDMTRAAWLWECEFTDEERAKVLAIMPMFAAYVMGLSVEDRKYVESPCAFLERMQMFDFEPDEAWLPKIEVEYSTVYERDASGRLTGEEKRVPSRFWRLTSDGRTVGPFRTREQAEGMA